MSLDETRLDRSLKPEAPVLSQLPERTRLVAMHHPKRRISAPVLSQQCTRFVAMTLSNSLYLNNNLASESMNLKELELSVVDNFPLFLR